MTIAYDGAPYFGWQIQPDKTTVQGELESALHKLTGESRHIHSAGRTDAGVHALGQVAHFDLATPWIPWQLQRGLNAWLPDTIRIMAVKNARPDFHARYDAIRKEYRYSIWNAPAANPILRHSATHIWAPMNVPAMKQAAAILVGRHDFAAFSANPRREIDGTVRTLLRLDVRRRDNLITIAAIGSGFLYKMVRSLAGHLVRVGLGAVPAEETRAILESKTRTARVETAPAQALCLWKIHYR